MNLWQTYTNSRWFKTGKPKHFICLVSILLVLSGSKIQAQEKFSLTGGWGFYELLHIGGQWNISSKSSLGIFAGSNLGINDQTQWSAGLNYGYVFENLVSWKIKPCFSLGAIFWTQDDELYYFQTISFPLMLGFAYPVSPKLSIRAEGGVIFSSVLVSDRKQNVESGFPDRFNGNFRINLIYKFGKK